MKIRNIILIFAATVPFVACTADFDETNVNPNKITVESGTLDAYSMFQPILYGGANAQTYNTWFWNNELVQYTAFTGGTTRQEHRYFIGDQNWQSIWNTYSRYASNDVNMLDLALAQKHEALQAVALTLKVYFMQNLTDIFGDIPYSEAFKADAGVTKPRFDSQQEVYQQMCMELERANRLYARAPYVEESRKTLDRMYGFDMEKWRRFNNSLYLRLLCRISGRPETVVDSVHNVAEKLQQIVDHPDTYPIFRDNADNATVRNTGASPYIAEFVPTTYTESEFTSAGRKLTEQFIGLTVVKDPSGTQTDLYADPRLKIFGNYCKGYTYWKGTIAGAEVGEETSRGDRGASWLNYSTLCRGNSDEWLMDVAEVRFILAEAALRGLIGGGERAARAYYESAVSASCAKWSDFAGAVSPDYVIAPADVDALLASPLASWDAAENKQELVAKQKFIALFWTGMEGWAEYRRTGYPRLKVGNGCVYNDFVLPTRFAYPNTTMATNGDHAAEALQRMGGANDMKTPLWWSKKAINP